MKRFFLICSLLLTAFLTILADGFDTLKEALAKSLQVQEKVYMHIDNTCYFVGDTLWYKAYVLRANTCWMLNFTCRTAATAAMTAICSTIIRWLPISSASGMACFRACSRFSPRPNGRGRASP